MQTILGTFFGLGRLPGPSGTYTSAVTAALLYLALWLGCPFWGVLVAAAVVAAVGIAVAPACIKAFGSKDPHPFVLDEVAGMCIAALPAWCPHMTEWAGSALALAVAFFWFRVFDVIKPPPIRLLERLPAGWGIMADDILAAVYALLVTSGSLYLLNLYLTSIEVAR